MTASPAAMVVGKLFWQVTVAPATSTPPESSWRMTVPEPGVLPEKSESPTASVTAGLIGNPPPPRKPPPPLYMALGSARPAVSATSASAKDSSLSRWTTSSKRARSSGVTSLPFAEVDVGLPDVGDLAAGAEVGRRDGPVDEPLVTLPLGLV